MIAGLEKFKKHCHIRTPYQLMLVAAVVLTVYYPIAFGGLSRIDDLEILEYVRTMKAWNLADIFIPHMQNGAYYRPVLMLSYKIDKYLFNLDPGFMHIHNILLHTFNVLLLFWLVGQLTSGFRGKKTWLPLLAALVFGLHPIATESVCWIAGRTDVLACTFILLSANCLILFKKTNFYRYVALSVLFMVLGFLTKEVTISFLPGAFLLAVSPRYPAADISREAVSQNSSLQRYRNLFVYLLAFGAVLLFFMLRHFAFSSTSGRITATIQFVQNDVISAGLIFLRALGFYIKKVFFPFPLSFTITDIDPFYEFLGVPVVILSFLILTKRSKESALFMTGIFLIMPSFIIALGQISWTAFAERYMYLPAAFIMAAVVLFTAYLNEKMTPFRLKPAVVVLLLPAIVAAMAITTFQRSTVWKDSFSFLKDLVVKNPDFCIIQALYADEISIRGDINNARVHFEIANRYNKRKKWLKNDGGILQIKYWEVPDIGLAGLLVRENKIPEAIAAYEKIICDSHGESVLALQNAIVLLHRLYNEESSADSYQTKKKLSKYSEKLYEKSTDGTLFFWLGRDFLTNGDKQEALAYFKKAESKFDDGNDYKIITQKFIAMLEKK